MKVRDIIKSSFIKDQDENLKLFCKEIRKNQRNKRDVVIAITGYPGEGKSSLAIIVSILIDFLYDLEKNICFIPTSDEIARMYMGLPIFSVLHIDEASRGLHKHKWYDKVQQKLNELYDTEREDHFLCTLVLIPRFQNLTENFRNFRVKYWINIIERGEEEAIALVYKRDEDKDAKDPWHIDENYKKKQKRWRGKRLFERELSDMIRAEQITQNYWFYFKFPDIPKEVRDEYVKLKRESRVRAKEVDLEVEGYQDKLQREKLERWAKIKEMRDTGHPDGTKYTNEEIGAVMGVSGRTIGRNLKEMDAYYRMVKGRPPDMTKTHNIIYNRLKENNSSKEPERVNKGQKVTN